MKTFLTFDSAKKFTEEQSKNRTEKETDNGIEYQFWSTPSHGNSATEGLRPFNSKITIENHFIDENADYDDLFGEFVKSNEFGGFAIIKTDVVE